MAAIRERLAAGIVEETVSIPLRAAGVLARLASLVQVTGTRYSGEQVEVRFRSRPETRERVARLLASPDAVPDAAPARAPRRAQ
jgi:50S ribosomal subunit-associated GTPase HflX